MTGFETLAIHAGQEPDAATGAVVPPIHLATTYAQAGVGSNLGYEYSRTLNPTRATLEGCISVLEGARYGRAFASGLAAEDAILRLLSPGDRVLVCDSVYGGTYRLLAQVHSRVGLEMHATDTTDPSAVEAAWQPGTKLLWVETPSNPHLWITDLAALSEIAHRHDALLVVDNTFATPYLQRPMSLGADLVVHSTTKYLGGHSDVVGGFVAVSDDELATRLHTLQNSVGAVPSPFDCYLVLRGAKTLAVRMERHCANAMRIAEMLVEHPEVARVHYPGLASHPGHKTAREQMRGFGGMVSFTLRRGAAAAVAVAGATELFTLAESLGAVESLIEHPSTMTHASTASSPIAVDPALVRLSVGLEDVDDLLADLEQALDRSSG